MISNFKEFLNNVIVENLHPELQNIIASPASNVSKQTLISKKIKDLTNRNEPTGIEGNMPKGSSRAYLKHSDLHPAVVDGHPTNLKTGTKVAIRADLDKYHNKEEHNDMSLGAMQNDAENNDYFVNSNYRTLINHGNDHFSSNENGIFPPLISHHDNNEWSHVGHARDISRKEFKDLTKTEDFPKGISHNEFYETLNRFHDRNNGKYWPKPAKYEAEYDKIEQHPLVQKFIDYHGSTGNPPHDYMQLKNMGVWEHPNGSKHIVARDHGFSSDVQKAYTMARRNQYK